MLTQPNLCPDEMYEVMQRTWAYNPRSRPSFSDLCVTIQAVANNF
jgi:hypothetical protein